MIRSRNARQRRSDEGGSAAGSAMAGAACVSYLVKDACRVYSMDGKYRKGCGLRRRLKGGASIDVELSVCRGVPF